jgi:hypothetical protein
MSLRIQQPVSMFHFGVSPSAFFTLVPSVRKEESSRLSGFEGLKHSEKPYARFQLIETVILSLFTFTSK